MKKNAQKNLEDEILLLYSSEEDRKIDAKDGVIGYRAVRSVVVGGSYYMNYAENWTELWADNNCKKVYLKLLHKICEMMKPQNVWEGNAVKLMEYFPDLKKSSAYEALKWLRDNEAITAIDRRRYFVSPDLVWKGSPALLGRAPRGYRLAQKPYNWQRWPDEEDRALHNVEWWQDKDGVYWRLN